jgi:hypothetical protein
MNVWDVLCSSSLRVPPITALISSLQAEKEPEMNVWDVLCSSSLRVPLIICINIFSSG